MRVWALLLLPFCIGAAAAAPQAVVNPDESGVVREVRVGEHLFLTDLGVSLTAPQWAGTRGNQRTLAHAVRSFESGEVLLTGDLTSGDAVTRLRERIRPIAGGMRLEYELTPQQNIAVENVLLAGSIPVAGNAGSTRYVATGEEVAQGVFPAELKPDSYIFFGNRPVEWVAFVHPDGSAVRLTLEGLSVALQDDRKFGTQAFGLQATAGGARTLNAGTPIRFAIRITADTAEGVQRDATRAAQSTLAGVPLSAGERLRAGKVSVDHAAVPVFARVELTPEIAATFDNPFDPEDVAVDAAITLPNGKQVSVPGFYYVPFRAEASDTRERLRIAGPPSWKIRFTPTLPGRYRAVVTVRDRNGKAQCPPVTFTATKAKGKGFVRTAPGSLYFRHDDGSAYYAVGENVCWSGAATPLKNYRDWFGALGAAGGNWARLWLSNNEKGLEWMPAPTPKQGRGAYLGLGRYALDNAWRLDEIVRLAEENGIRLMFCFGTYGELKADAGYFNEGAWVSNPYNAANGGPCREPQEFWTNPTARKRYKQRLRYILARWGYSPQVFAWEFWNEVKAPAAWVGEMAAYLKQHDVNRHLVSTTYGDDAAWKLPAVDFTMTHFYGDSGNVEDLSDEIVRTTRAQRQFGKPYFLAEFGIDWRASDGKYDPEGKGQNLHNGLWAGMMSGGAGSPMLWYWDGYVHPMNLYHQFTPVARFASRVDWLHSRFTPLSGIRFSRPAAGPVQYSDLNIVPGYGWGRQGGNAYTVLPDGTLDGGPSVSTLGSPKRHTPSELHTRLNFQLDMPAAGQFITRIGTVSSSASLQIRVDGKVAAKEAFAAGPEGKGPWKSSRYLKDWDVWQSDYDREITVPVPAGKHTVTLENLDGDWISFRSFRVTGYRNSRYPNARALGLRDGKTILLWLQNRQSTWRAVWEKQKLAPFTDLRVTLPGMANGTYQVEWWDTYQGKAVRRTTATAKGGVLTLMPPAFDRDIAAILHPLPSK